MKTLIGKLSETSVGKFYLRTKDGDKQLFFDAPHRTPTDTKIAIAVFDDFHVDPTVWYYNVLTPDSVDTDLIRMVIMRQIRDNASEEEKANELHKAQLRARDLQDFYNYYAKIVWEYKAEGFVYVSGNSASSPGYDAHVVDPAIAALNLSYVPDKIQVWQRWDPNNGRCGEATLWGKRGVAVEGCPQRTCNHEAGHSQGMSHSSSLNDNGSRSEYGGKDCIMGGASHIPGICAPQQQKMGMLSQRSQRTVDTNCEVLICPLELSDHAMFWQEDKVVTIRVPGHSDYTLSLRKDKGVPYRTGSAYRNGKICIHTMEGRYAVLVGTLNPGDSHDLFGVVNITYKEYGNETAVVNIKYAADRMPILEMNMPKGFPQKMQVTDLGRDHAGIWYEKRFNGQGVILHVNESDTTMLLYWFTYNQKEDSRRWYYAAIDLEAVEQEFVIYTRDKIGGDDTLAGTGQLYFWDTENGIFNFNTIDHGRGCLELSPVALEQAPNANVYYDPLYPDTGFPIHFFGDQCVAYWFDYGKSNGSHYPGNKTQRWYLCSGFKTENGIYNLNIYEYTKGKFQFFDHTVQLDVGAATLAVLGKGNLKISYLLNGETGTRDLIPVF